MPREGRVAVGLGDLAARDLPVHVAADDLGRGLERRRGDVVQHHVEAGEREDMGDAVAHLTGADHADRLISMAFGPASWSGASLGSASATGAMALSAGSLHCGKPSRHLCRAAPRR